MAELFTGFRRLPAIGNAQKKLSWTLSVPSSNQTYYWSVQGIDTAFAGSAWSEEQSVFVDAVLRDVQGKIVLQNYGGDLTQEPVTVELHKQGGTTTTRTINLAADGLFTVPNVETGKYDITFKASHWLSKTVRGVVVQ